MLSVVDCHEVNLCDTPVVKDEKRFKTWRVEMEKLNIMPSKNFDDLCVPTRNIVFMTQWGYGSHSRPILLQFNVAGPLLIVLSTIAI